MKRELKVFNLVKIFNFIDPMFFNITIVYIISLVYQYVFDVESVWQTSWDKVRAFLGDDPFNYYVVLINVYSYGLYWVLGLLLILMEYFNKQTKVGKYKIQQDKSTLHESTKLNEVVIVVIANQLIGVAASWMIFRKGNFFRFQMNPGLPSLTRVMFELFVCWCFHEISFYYTHRILHHKAIYKYFHKMHHEFPSPISICAMYSTPVENIVSNLIPIVGGFVLVSPHILTAMLWMTIAVTTTLHDHSGLHLPFLHSPEIHDYHHKTYTKNFSLYGIMDIIHNTQGSFQKSENFAHHITLYGLKSAREKVEESERTAALGRSD